MLICLYYEDLQVARYGADAVPPAGAAVTFRMKIKQGRFPAGWLVRGKVSSDCPPDYNFETLAPQLVVNVSVYDLEACFE